MKEQNYKNHRQYVITYHGVLYLLVIAFIIGAVRHALKATESNLYDAWLLVVAGVIFILLTLFTRSFALKAQDRAIRAEENLRHLAFTGKLLDSRLTMAQVVALRFASDNEFVALAQKAADQNLSAEAIKKEIKIWRADFYRV